MTFIAFLFRYVILPLPSITNTIFGINIHMRWLTRFRRRKRRRDYQCSTFRIESAFHCSSLNLLIYERCYILAIFDDFRLFNGCSDIRIIVVTHTAIYWLKMQVWGFDTAMIFIHAKASATDKAYYFQAQELILKFYYGQWISVSLFGFALEIFSAYHYYYALSHFSQHYRHW